MTRPQQSTRHRRWLLWSGLTLIAGGLALLGYVGWQLHGTTWVSERKQAEAIKELERAWSAGEERATIEAGSATAVLRIPRFGPDFAVPILAGTTDDVLASGIGHFEGSAAPGERGNVALAGHRITHGEPLARMPDLQPGDEVVIETAEAVFTYRLDTGGDDLRVPFTETWVVDPVPVNPDAGEPGPSRSERLLTLTTCAELFSTEDRLVAFGHLVSTERRRQPPRTTRSFDGSGSRLRSAEMAASATTGPSSTTSRPI